MIDSSLGYFITPLVNVLLAVLVLRERPTRLQWWAVALAALGVALLGWELGQLPWISLALACSFGLYGLLRKIAAVDAMHGLAIESGLMALPALPYLVWCAQLGQGHFLVGHTGTDLLLLLAGPITAIPLALFAWGVRRVSMLAIGVMQYIAPSVQLVIGVWVFHEPFDRPRQLAFGLIWVAWRYSRARRYGATARAPRHCLSSRPGTRSSPRSHRDARGWSQTRARLDVVPRKPASPPA